MSSPLIRPARPDEYDGVGDLVVRAYLAEGPIGEDEAELRSTADRAAAGTLLIAADDDGALLGTVTVLLRPSRWTELAGDGDAEVRMLAVDPPARGRGVGRALATASIELSKDAGARRIVLSTAAIFQSAQRIYGRLGFRRRPDLDWSPRPGVDLIAYVLPL